MSKVPRYKWTHDTSYIWHTIPFIWQMQVTKIISFTRWWHDWHHTFYQMLLTGISNYIHLDANCWCKIWRMKRRKGFSVLCTFIASECEQDWASMEDQQSPGLNWEMKESNGEPLWFPRKLKSYVYELKIWTWLRVSINESVWCSSYNLEQVTAHPPPQKPKHAFEQHTFSQPNLSHRYDIVGKIRAGSHFELLNQRQDIAVFC